MEDVRFPKHPKHLIQRDNPAQTGNTRNALCPRRIQFVVEPAPLKTTTSKLAGDARGERATSGVPTFGERSGEISKLVVGLKRAAPNSRQINFKGVTVAVDTLYCGLTGEESWI